MYPYWVLFCMSSPRIMLTIHYIINLAYGFFFFFLSSYVSPGSVFHKACKKGFTFITTREPTFKVRENVKKKKKSGLVNYLVELNPSDWVSANSRFTMLLSSSALFVKRRIKGSPKNFTRNKPKPQTSSSSLKKNPRREVFTSFSFIDSPASPSWLSMSLPHQVELTPPRSVGVSNIKRKYSISV